MSEEIEHLDFPTPDENSDPEREVDPGTLANLDQEQQAFQDAKMQFARVYGFVHDCHCAEDYEKGNTVNVAECFVNLCNQAMAVLSFTNQENKQLRLYLEQMMTMNNDLANMLKERGFEDDLEKYFTEEIEEQDEAEDEIVDLEAIEDDEQDDDDGDEELVIS